MYSSKNMHYIFHREYYESAGSRLDLTGNRNNDPTHASLVEQRNRDLFGFDFPPFDYLSRIEKQCAGFRKITLYVTYPGLLAGIGYPHDSQVKGSINGGFSFDYVTGLPVIPGSTLKGVLRSCFSCRGEEREEKRKWISGLAECEKDELAALEQACFEKADVFLGGYPVVENNGRLLEKESFAPQKDPLGDPNVLTYVKLRPNVSLTFAFLLFDDEKVGLTADDKKALYEKLLKEIGIGAKTNEGYGRLSGESLSDNQNPVATGNSNHRNNQNRGGNQGYGGNQGRGNNQNRRGYQGFGSNQGRNGNRPGR